MTPSLAEFRTRFPAVAAHASSDDLDALLGAMTSLQIGQGETVIKEGDSSAPLYFVMEGTLNCLLEKEGEKAQIGQIVAGQFVGEIAILDDGPSTATIISDSPCTLLELPRSGFQALETTNPEIASTLLRTITKLLVERLRSSDQLLFDAFGEKQQPSVKSAHLNPREWVLRVYKRLTGYEGDKP
jgi:CRP-like cAMP-binding protein